MTRTIYALMHTAGAVLFAGILTAMTGATLKNAFYLFDIGMWLQIGAMGAYAALLTAFVADCARTWLRPQR